LHGQRVNPFKGPFHENFDHLCRRSGGGAGCNHHLVKPADPADLRELLGLPKAALSAD
jgi:hypothetical protein